MEFAIKLLINLLLLPCVFTVFFVFAIILKSACGVLMMPFFAIFAKVCEKFDSEIEPRTFFKIVCSAFLFIFQMAYYYIVCMWPALVIYIFTIINTTSFPFTSWGGGWAWEWLAIAGFLAGGIISRVTVTTFILFCWFPFLIEKVYGWIPLFSGL